MWRVLLIRKIYFYFIILNPSFLEVVPENLDSIPINTYLKKTPETSSPLFSPHLLSPRQRNKS